MNDKILIIANGPSILQYKFGNHIDKFKNIARINNYKIEGFNEYIGEKTSIWFNGGNQNLTIPYKLPNEIIVFIPYDLQNKNLIKIQKRTSQRLNLNTSKYNLIPKDEMLKFEKISNVKRPTTGLNSILWSISNYKKVIIHGFDFFQGSKNHYYDSFFGKKISYLKDLLFSEKHNHYSEKKFVEKLIKDKRVISLVDYLN